jgi:hypothetical protein
MTSWRQQAVFDAPLEDVWAFVGDPRRYPEWAADVVSVTGIASLATDAEYQQVSRTPLRRTETTFKIEELDDLHSITLRCQKSGYYSRWVLTEAQSSTFADFEIGIDPTALQYRLLFGAAGKRYLRRIAEQGIEGLRVRLEGAASATPSNTRGDAS